MEPLKTFEIFSISKPHGEKTIIDKIKAHYISPTNAGFGIYIFAGKDTYENDTLIYGVPMGCGVEEIK
jgi:hypothetical protein